jgi:hypothetical protein
VEIAASWTNFHLAEDEYAASAVAHKAREVLDLSKSFARPEIPALNPPRTRLLPPKFT